uniref:Lipase n=1 Tax=Phlebotomus papatasi TaxID=29031 RepID=A0A1B0DJ51_PHLPP
MRLIIYLLKPEMVIQNGYPVENHVVTTSDGYVLTMHRIPHGKVPDDTKRPVVFLQHALFSSSADWVVVGPARALGYLLADHGYDVWMGNARGNTYSREHEILDPNSEEFWDFSWHEIGIYDLSAMLDYVTTNTGLAKVHYVGHAQGVTSLLVLLSILTDYNNYFLSISALSPVAYMYHCKSPIMRALALLQLPMEVLIAISGNGEFILSSELIQSTNSVTCMNGSPVQETELPAIMSNLPAPVSNRQIIHFSQSINVNNFRQYDYGPIENLDKYGTLTPPEYALEKITAAIGLFYGKNDWIADVVDVEHLYSKLPNVVKYHEVPYDKFTHLDFLYAIDVKPLFYDDLIAFIDKYFGPVLAFCGICYNAKLLRSFGPNA